MTIRTSLRDTLAPYMAGLVAVTMEEEGKEYQVRRGWCTCPAWQGRTGNRGFRFRCKHQEEVERKLLG